MMLTIFKSQSANRQKHLELNIDVSDIFHAINSERVISILNSHIDTAAKMLHPNALSTSTLHQQDLKFVVIVAYPYACISNMKITEKSYDVERYM
jgi:hypothetical protein